MLVEQRLKGDKDKVLSSDLMIMHWNIYNNMVKIHDIILMICMHCAETKTTLLLACTFYHSEINYSYYVQNHYVILNNQSFSLIITVCVCVFGVRENHKKS